MTGFRCLIFPGFSLLVLGLSSEALSLHGPTLGSDANLARENEANGPVVFTLMSDPRLLMYDQVKSLYQVFDCWFNQFLKVSSSGDVDVLTLDDATHDYMNTWVSAHPDAKGRILHRQPEQRETNLQSVNRAYHRVDWAGKDYMLQIFPGIQKHLLSGRQVLHSDLDAVWVRDPWPTLNQILKEHPDVDIIGSTMYGPEANGKPDINIGFTLFMPTKNTLGAIEDLTRIGEQGKVVRRMMGHLPGDQDSLIHRIGVCTWRKGNGDRYDSTSTTDHSIRFNMEHVGPHEFLVGSCDDLHGDSNVTSWMSSYAVSRPLKMKVVLLNAHQFARDHLRVLARDLKRANYTQKTSLPEEVIVAHPPLSLQYWQEQKLKRNTFEHFQMEAPGVCKPPDH